MKKIYFYENCDFPVHDNISEYAGCVPFSKYNLNKNYNTTNNIYEADYVYMGQFTCMGKPFKKENFKHFNQFAWKHICDLEGDWTHNYAAKEVLENCIITTNGAKKEYSKYYNRIFIRPTFSKLLINIVKNYKPMVYKPIYNRAFAFKGYPDPFGVRLRIAKLINQSHIHADIEFNERWNGNSNYKDPVVAEYIKKIYNNTFSLCPRGAGIDTVRFFESCYFGRIPIVIANNLLFGERDFHKPFFFKIDPNLSDKEIIDNLKEISNLKQEKIDEMSLNCIEFFDKNVIEYFKNPDKAFFNWLNKGE